jgi:peptide-methionine (R)-S-oxide reductase
MNRRHLLIQILGFAALPFLKVASAAEALLGKLQKPASAWKTQLAGNAYKVLFEEDTERAFSHPYNKEKHAGIFLCAACYQPLFSSDTKFDSGTGWPSFWRPITSEVIGTKVDNTFFTQRTEYHCSRCGGHQGHVFDDGPAPTGLRYCNNGLALYFVPQGTPPPALRA